MSLSSKEYLYLRHMLHEALAFESACPLCEIEDGGYEAVVPSHYEGYTYKVEGSIVPQLSQMSITFRSDVLLLPSEQDARLVLAALAAEEWEWFQTTSIQVAAMWGTTEVQGCHFPRLRMLLASADTLAQSDLHTVLRKTRTLLDDALPVFAFAAAGGPAAVLAKERASLALRASIGGSMQ